MPVIEIWTQADTVNRGMIAFLPIDVWPRWVTILFLILLGQLCAVTLFSVLFAVRAFSRRQRRGSGSHKVGGMTYRGISRRYSVADNIRCNLGDMPHSAADGLAARRASCVGGATFDTATRNPILGEQMLLFSGMLESNMLAHRSSSSSGDDCVDVSLPVPDIGHSTMTTTDPAKERDKFDAEAQEKDDKSGSKSLMKRETARTMQTLSAAVRGFKACFSKAEYLSSSLESIPDSFHDPQSTENTLSYDDGNIIYEVIPARVLPSAEHLPSSVTSSADGVDVVVKENCSAAVATSGGPAHSRYTSTPSTKKAVPLQSNEAQMHSLHASPTSSVGMEVVMPWGTSTAVTSLQEGAGHSRAGTGPGAVGKTSMSVTSAPHHNTSPGPMALSAGATPAAHNAQAGQWQNQGPTPSSGKEYSTLISESDSISSAGPNASHSAPTSEQYESKPETINEVHEDCPVCETMLGDVSERSQTMTTCQDQKPALSVYEADIYEDTPVDVFPDDNYYDLVPQEGAATSLDKEAVSSSSGSSWGSAPVAPVAVETPQYTQVDEAQLQAQTQTQTAPTASKTPEYMDVISELGSHNDSSGLEAASDSSLSDYNTYSHNPDSRSVKARPKGKEINSLRLKRNLKRRKA